MQDNTNTPILKSIIHKFAYIATSLFGIIPDVFVCFFVAAVDKGTHDGVAD
jgi:hypothetical protein